jgi:hypothetical protein
MQLSRPPPLKTVATRVARWHIFKPKIPTWVNWEGPAEEDVDVFYNQLVYLRPLGMFCGHLVYF